MATLRVCVIKNVHSVCTQKIWSMVAQQSQMTLHINEKCKLHSIYQAGQQHSRIQRYSVCWICFTFTTPTWIYHPPSIFQPSGYQLLTSTGNNKNTLPLSDSPVAIHSVTAQVLSLWVIYSILYKVTRYEKFCKSLKTYYIISYISYIFPLFDCVRLDNGKECRLYSKYSGRYMNSTEPCEICEQNFWWLHENH